MPTQPPAQAQAQVLRVFYAAAKNLSFSKAAQELYITQPAVTKHMRALEEHYEVLLFERVGNKITLTPAGQIMLEHVELILAEYQNLSYAMHRLSNKHVGQLRLGASSTIAQYVIAPYLAAFLEHYPDAQVSLINGNSREIERALTEHDIDLGMVEGITRQPTLNYSAFMADELVVLTGHRHAPPQSHLTIEQFKTMPLVLRERGSGTLEAIEHDLSAQHLKLNDLNIQLFLGSTEAIKLFVQNSHALCILSRTAITRELQDGLLTELTVEGLSFKRNFSFVQGRPPKTHDSPLYRLCPNPQRPSSQCPRPQRGKPALNAPEEPMALITPEPAAELAQRGLKTISFCAIPSLSGGTTKIWFHPPE